MHPQVVIHAVTGWSQQIGIALSAVLLVACTHRGLVESNFELAPESRLPSWIEVPEGTEREDVQLALTYYTPFSESFDDTVFILSIKGQRGKKLTGDSWWHPKTKKELDKYYATEPRPEFPHPSYVVVEIDGQIDVIEHREGAQQNRDPSRALFWMTDNRSIIEEASDAR